MRPLTTLIFMAAVFAAALIPSSGFAADDLSWCVPGDAKLQGSSQDPTTNDVVRYVCGQPGLDGCCNTASGTGRWTLLCVQKGADYLFQTQQRRDPCSRFIWTNQSIPGAKPQYYPNDFNLVTLGGGAFGFRDIQGPIAANGNVSSATGFNLGGYSQKPYALVATGTVNLSSGAVYGNVVYGADPSYIPSNVTFRYGAASKSNSIITQAQFADLTNSLKIMSRTLSQYPISSTTSATLKDQTITLRGLDPELNVFSISADKIESARTLKFDVPPGSAAIVNITGSGMAFFKWAGFEGVRGVPTNSRLLWNLPDVTTLAIASVTIPGSILAPNAYGSFLNGQINGTVIVQAASADIEIHWAPYHGLAASGCLSWDSKWSCSDDTYLDLNEKVAFPAPEAGFLQIDGESYKFKNTASSKTYTRSSPTHRIWYSFQPAAIDPETKPLAVFFNGGPGGSTSAGLFSFNTGPRTLDPDWISGREVGDNPNSWTQFANLLYIDAPATGFSYPVPSTDGKTPSVGLDIYREAGIFLQVITRFLDRHSPLRCNPVILVGESFGGTRAAMMLDHIYNYQALSSGNSVYQDVGLHDDLDSHISYCSNQGSSQFGRQVLIEPVIAGSLQTVTYKRPSDATGCVSGGDVYQCNQTDPADPNTKIPTDQTWYWGKIRTVATNLTHIATLRAALGVSPVTIAWFYKDARAGAYSHGPSDDLYFSIPTSGGGSTFGSSFDATFGSLPSGDSYFVTLNNTVRSYYRNEDGTTATTDSDPTFGVSFLYALCNNNVKTFITHSDHDKAVSVLAIQRSFLDPIYSPLVSDCVPDDTYPNSSRRGQLKLTCRATNPVHEIRFPEYSDAGHSVSQRMPGPLLTDVMQWTAN